MRRRLGGRSIILGTALVAAMMLVGSETAFGQDKKKISYTTKPENIKVTYHHRLEIADMAGHRFSMS